MVLVNCINAGSVVVVCSFWRQLLLLSLVFEAR
jgi:hypothetical protein